MAMQWKGFMTRLLEGKEKSEEYARNSLPSNRWQLFWDIFKGNFWKIVKVNFLILIFFIPLFVVLILNNLYADSNGILYPFGANLGIGYPAMPSLPGVSETLTMQTELIAYLGIMVASIIAAVGLSGGLYVIRNMVWTEGIFVANDFWKGIKLNFKNTLQATLFFTLALFVGKLVINMANFSLAIGGMSKLQTVFLRISQGMSYLVIVLAAMMFLWMLALGVNYQMGFFLLFKNSFLMMLGTLPQTVFFGAIALIPFALFFLSGSLFISFALVMLLLFSFSYCLLVWLDFAQWVFDRYVNPKIEGAKVNRGIYKRGETAASGESEASLEYQRAILAHGKSRLVARPIKPIDDSLQVYELPQSFTREDLKRLRESKQNIMEDTENYAEEHKNDLRYVEYNKQFEERERALQEEEETKGKKKRAKKPPKLLNK